MSKKIILLLLCFITFYTVFARNVIISINATQNKRLISPYIYGRNESFDKPVQFYKDAGLRFARMNGGNNATGYNWRKKITVHPDWYNNVYGSNWDAYAQSIAVRIISKPFTTNFNLKGFKPGEILRIRIFDIGGKQVETIQGFFKPIYSSQKKQ